MVLPRSLKSFAVLLSLFVGFAVSSASAYEGGALKNHNHSSAAGDGGVLSGITLLGNNTGNFSSGTYTATISTNGATWGTPAGSVGAFLNYRRPTLVFVSATEVDISSGNTSVPGQIGALFPDGSYLVDSSTMASTCIFTSTASWGNGIQTSGMAPLAPSTPEVLGANLWKNIYLVKSSATLTGTGMAKFVCAISSITPITAHYTILNTRFGTNSYIYVGVIPWGANDTTSTNAVQRFSMGNNRVYLGNACNAILSTHGVRLAHTAAATNLTYTYAAGSDLSSSQIPPQITFGDYAVVTAAVTQITTLNSGGTYNQDSFTMSSGGTGLTHQNVGIADGFRNNDGLNVAKDIILQSYEDGVLESPLSQL